MGYECYKNCPGGWDWNLCVQDNPWTLQNRGKNVFPAHSALPTPRVIDHYLQTEIFSGEKMSPAFRIQYLPWLCSAFAGIHGLQQFWGRHGLPSQILTPLGPSPVLALYPNVTQRRQDSRWSMTAPIKATQIGSALTAPDRKGVLFLIPLFLSLKECSPCVD